MLTKGAHNNHLQDSNPQTSNAHTRTTARRARSRTSQRSPPNPAVGTVHGTVPDIYCMYHGPVRACVLSVVEIWEPEPWSPGVFLPVLYRYSWANRRTPRGLRTSMGNPCFAPRCSASADAVGWKCHVYRYRCSWSPAHPFVSADSVAQ